jgi:hypothetical protein
VLDPTGPALTLRAYAWAAPCSAIGLLLGLVGAAMFGASWHRVHGTIEIALPDRHDRHDEGGDRRLGKQLLAITFGHVILGIGAAQLHRLRRHERAHVAQYERWGPLFLLAYPLASLWPWLHGGDAYRDNVFEVQARRAETAEAGIDHAPGPER